jgi:hypothetical protein
MHIRTFIGSVFLLLCPAWLPAEDPAAKPSAATAPANPFDRYLPSEDAADCAECKRNLERIGVAILAYRKDHKDIPNWLSDLVPKYLPEESVFICPVTRKTDRLSPFGALDPKIRCSYLFGFAPVQIPAVIKGAFQGPMMTMREWKRQQMGIVGSEVPIVRCLLHKPVLNLSFGGRIYESPLFWEENYLDVTNMEALSPH